MKFNEGPFRGSQAIAYGQRDIAKLINFCNILLRNLLNISIETRSCPAAVKICADRSTFLRSLH